jgi:uncharacterized protein (DUF58 family)
MGPQTQSSGRKLAELLGAEFMARLDRIDLVSRKMLQGKLQGERRSKRRGQSAEFADHRPYVVGDDMRFVDWNIYGRLNQLFVKLFLEELDLTVHIACDCSLSMSTGDPRKDEFGRKLAAALGYIGLVNNNRVTVSMFADGVVRQLANMRGRNYLGQLGEMIAGTECSSASDFDAACRHIEASRTGRGIVIILSDFLFKGGYDSGLRRLIGRNHDLYVIQILSRQELAPDISGDLKLVDIEDDDVSEVTVSSALLKYYKRNLTSYCNELKDFCARRGATYALANAGDSVESLVLNYLRRVRLLR